MHVNLSFYLLPYLDSWAHCLGPVLGSCLVTTLVSALGSAGWEFAQAFLYVYSHYSLNVCLVPTLYVPMPFHFLQCCMSCCLLVCLHYVFMDWRLCLGRSKCSLKCTYLEEFVPQVEKMKRFTRPVISTTRSSEKKKKNLP